MTDTPDLTEAQARVLAALEGGADLVAHRRDERGPFYTLGGRRLPVTLLKSLEDARLLQRDTARSRASGFRLTETGRAALGAWRDLHPEVPSTP
ncbi:hypothetical protein [Deinococcus pimensis]|uniref:hypothetical protein n=1 Tax=Deinococcus pimensis TaxID=309888 RepID=UPI0005EB7CDB|nr:hypothetical protein [Deinococcus pimensis]